MPSTSRSYWPADEIQVNLKITKSSLQIKIFDSFSTVFNSTVFLKQYLVYSVELIFH